MTISSPEDLARDNAYLRARNEQLQNDVTALSAEVGRLTERLERLHGATAVRAPNPLSGGN